MIFLTSFRKEYKCSYEKIIEKKKEFEISEEEYLMNKIRDKEMNLFK